MVLIFTQKMSPRVTYVFHQVLGRILGFEVNFTSKIEEFIACKEVKFSYGETRMGNEVFVKAHGFLYRQGVQEIHPEMSNWGEIPCFFETGEGSDIPFDIFSASFFMMTRYEEYYANVHTEDGRYIYENSLAYKNKFLAQPVVDLWAYKFRNELKKHFPDKIFSERKYKTINILAVAEAYKYREKGLLRNLGGGVGELFSLRLKALYSRIKVQLFLRPDPYDVYKELLQFSKQRKIKWKFMFQLSDFSLHNKNLGHNKNQYHTLIKSMGDYGKVGLLLGRDAIFESGVLKREKKRWERILNRDLEIAISNDFGINLPDLYNNFDALEIPHDYSMGYIEEIGFRAGTCTSFLFYDLKLERISHLILHPTTFNSTAFSDKSFFEVKTKLEKMQTLIKKVNGDMRMRYKNSDFAEEKTRDKYYQLLEKMNEF